MNIKIALVVLVLGVLACGQYVTPTPASLPTETPPNALVDTPTPFLTDTPVPVAALVETWTALVERPTVNVRSSPNGEAIGSVSVGSEVTILQCVDGWCQIVEPPGWVWRGCLSDNPDGLECRSK